MKRYILILLCFISSSSTFCQPIDKAKLESIIKAGADAHSDGIVLVQNNQVIVEEYYGNPVTPTYVASISKALTGIAIIKLLSEGKIQSIDQPVADFYPEWKQGNKKHVTLRMLLSHTSGLQNERNAGLELEPPPTGRIKNIIKLALAAELSAKPGTVFGYNNKATSLLGGIIEQASGRRMDHYFEMEFFKPMNIAQWEWIRDEDGNPTAHGAFRLTPLDLAKFGQLMLNKGVYNGKQFFEARWVDSAFAQSQDLNSEVGLLWWRKPKRMMYTFSDSTRLRDVEKADLPKDFLARYQTLYHRSYTYEALINQYGQTFGPRWPRLFDSLSKAHNIDLRGIPKKTSGQEIIGYYHTGSWGNYLVLVPELNLVAVRVVKRDQFYSEEKDMYGGFMNRVFDLIQR